MTTQTSLANYITGAIMAPVRRLFHYCRHQHISRVFGSPYNPKTDPTYVVCLDCGAKFPYDWATMRRGKEVVS
jgi:hypothetical protein